MKKTKTKKCQPTPKLGAAEIKTSLGVTILLLFFIGVVGLVMSAV